MIRHFQEHKSKALTQAKAASADRGVLDPGGQRQGSWQSLGCWPVGRAGREPGQLSSLFRGDTPLSQLGTLSLRN